jgi:ABC-2 type transport system permease protein
MHKTLVVAVREFRQRIRTRGFLLASVGTPLLLTVVWAFVGAFDTGLDQPISSLIEAQQFDRTVGYVDQADLIAAVPPPLPERLFRSFPNIEAAEAALARGDIAAYYVVKPDYRTTGEVERVSERLPMAAPDTEWFEWLLINNLLPDASPEEVTRLRWPFNARRPAFVNLGAAGETGGGNVMLPFLVVIAVMAPLFTSGSYLLQSLAQEKSSRIMEILLVSLRPRQLLTGKLVGLGALTLVQYAIWLAIGGLAAGVTGADPTRLLSSINLTPGELLLGIPYAVGGFALYATLMAGIGALAPDVEGSRAWVFLVSVPMLIPLYLWTAITSAPNGSLAVVLSLIPLSAPIAMLMRITSTSVPTWQIAVSLGLLLIAAIVLIRLMARLFRVHTLLSGESISLRRAWSALHG